MTPDNNNPRPQRIGAPIRLAAPADAEAARGPARPRTGRTAFVTMTLVALLIAGWALLAPRGATRAAPAAPPVQTATPAAPSPTATNTPEAAAQQTTLAPPTEIPATATPSLVPATATPTQVPATAAVASPTPVATSPAGGQTAGAALLTAGQTQIQAARSIPTATPTTAPTTAPARAPVPAVPAKAIIAGFPSVAQWYNLSCEYAAAAAVTLYWGNLVSQNTFLNAVPSNPNPHLGFRGAINAPFGGLTNYGVYAEALVPVLVQHGYNAVTFYGGVDRLKAEVAAGHPVVVWFTAGKYIPRTPVTASANGATFKLVPGEHAVVIYGYDSGGVYIMDVSHGQFDYATWGSFLTRWSYLDQMALVITPQ